MLHIEVVTAPATEPLTASDAKTHLRETATGQDTRIALAIESARMAVENFTGRALITRTLSMKLPGFPCEIILPRAPLASATQVDSVKYVDNDGVEQTLVLDTDYRVLAPSGPQADHGRIILPYNGSWPTPRGQPDAVRVQWTAGYATTASGVPGALREAMLLLIGDAYENREAQIANGALSINRTVENILWPFRLETPRLMWP